MAGALVSSFAGEPKNNLDLSKLRDDLPASDEERYDASSEASDAPLPPKPKGCTVCKLNSKPELTCQDCASAHYCSPECKIIDRIAHVLLCPAGLDIGSLPSENHRRVIVLPGKKTKPYLKWVQVWKPTLEAKNREVKEDWQIEAEKTGPVRAPQVILHVEEPTLAELSTIFGGKTAFGDIEYNLARARNLPAPGFRMFILEADYPYTGPHGARRVNKCVQHIQSLCAVGKNGEKVPLIHGTVMFAFYEGDHSKIRDATAGDMREIVDYVVSASLENYAYHVHERIGRPQNEISRKLKGVRGCNTYTPTMYPTDFPFVHKQTPEELNIDQLLNMPLFFFKVPDELCNPRFLNRGIGLKAEVMYRAIVPGEVHQTDRTPTSYNWHICRTDGRDLMSQHLSALCAYMHKICVDSATGQIYTDVDFLVKKIAIAGKVPIWKGFFKKYEAEEGWVGVTEPWMMKDSRGNLPEEYETARENAREKADRGNEELKAVAERIQVLEKEARKQFS